MKKLIAPILLLVCLTFTAFAQSGQLSGTVKDRNGAFIPGGEAILTGPSGFFRRTAVGAAGEFSFGDNLTPGKYILHINSNGFAPSEMEVEVSAQNTSFDVVLDIGAETFSVTAEVGSEIDRRKIPQPTNKIGEIRIRQRAISVLSQAGSEETGLNVQKTSPTMGQIVVRGLTGKNVVNYVDGVRYTTGAQRGGVNTFFNLNDASNLQAIEVVRGPSSAQYGSDSLSGTVNLLTRVPEFGFEKGRFIGEIMPFFSSANRSFGSNAMIGYGSEKFGGL